MMFPLLGVHSHQTTPDLIKEGNSLFHADLSAMYSLATIGYGDLSTPAVATFSSETRYKVPPPDKNFMYTQMTLSLSKVKIKKMEVIIVLE